MANIFLKNFKHSLFTINLRKLELVKQHGNMQFNDPHDRNHMTCGRSLRTLTRWPAQFVVRFVRDIT